MTTIDDVAPRAWADGDESMPALYLVTVRLRS
jgi:hypothetical protein